MYQFLATSNKGYVLKQTIMQTNSIINFKEVLHPRFAIILRVRYSDHFSKHEPLIKPNQIGFTESLKQILKRLDRNTKPRQPMISLSFPFSPKELVQ